MQTSGASHLGAPVWPTRCLARPSMPLSAPPCASSMALTLSRPYLPPSCKSSSVCTPNPPWSCIFSTLVRTAPCSQRSSCPSPCLLLFCRSHVGLSPQVAGQASCRNTSVSRRVCWEPPQAHHLTDRSAFALLFSSLSSLVFLIIVTPWVGFHLCFKMMSPH